MYLHLILDLGSFVLFGPLWYITEGLEHREMGNVDPYLKSFEILIIKSLITSHGLSAVQIWSSANHLFMTFICQTFEQMSKISWGLVKDKPNDNFFSKTCSFCKVIGGTEL